MDQICILTDSSAQFNQQNFCGEKIIKKINLSIDLGQLQSQTKQIDEINQLPITSCDSARPILLPPTVQTFEKMFHELEQEFDEIIVILLSQHLCDAYSNAKKAIENISSKNKIHLFDSESFSVGLGSIVQKIALLVVNNHPIEEITYEIRKTIPKSYGIFCSPNHNYLHSPGFLDPVQALMLEMVGMIPIFTIEEGYFCALDKMKNIKNCYLLFEEFIDEFEKLNQVNFIYGFPPRLKESRLLKTHCIEFFKDIPYNHQLLNIPSSILIGPKAMGVFVLDSSN